MTVLIDRMTAATSTLEEDVVLIGKFRKGAVNETVETDAGIIPTLSGIIEEVRVATGITTPVGGGSSGTFSSMYDLLMEHERLIHGTSYSTSTFYSGKGKGGGDYMWISDMDKTLANGGTIIDPLVAIPILTESFDETRLVDYLASQGSGEGVGCLVRVYDSVSVEMFGGVSTLVGAPVVDVTTCFKKIMATIPEPAIELLEGTYAVSTTAKFDPAINLPSNSSIKGAGKFATTIFNNSTGINTCPLGSYGTNSVVIEDLGVDGNVSRFPDTSGLEGDGIDFNEDTTNVTLRGLYIRNVVGEGIDCDGVTGITMDDILITDCGGNGLHISDRQPPRFCNITNVTIERCAVTRGLSGDPRCAGLVLRASDINISNIIIKDCWMGIVQNGSNVSSANKSACNLANLTITGSVKEDVITSTSSSGLNISNFTINRDTGNTHPISMLIESIDGCTLSNGRVYTDKDIVLKSVTSGMTVNNLIAPTATMKIEKLSRFSITGSVVNNINLVGVVNRGAIGSNVINGSITEYGGTYSLMTITGNQCTSISESLKTNSSVTVMGNIEG